VHAENPSFIGTGTNNRAIALPRNDDGFTLQLGIISLLDRGIKRVHVDVEDFAHDFSCDNYCFLSKTNATLRF
jgi:hypothetical protein